MQEENKSQKVFFVGFGMIILVILVFFLKPVFLSWKNSDKKSTEDIENAEILKAPSIMPEDLFQKTESKAKVFLVDISPNADFNRGHIAASVNVDAEKIDKNFLKNLGTDEAANIVLINQGDNLGFLAAETNKIVAMGFVNAKYLRGGIPGWIEKGYPLISGGSSTVDQAKVKKISIEEVMKNTNDNSDSYQFIDIRDTSLYKQGHIAKAVSIPLSELETRKLEIPSVQKVVVYGDEENDAFQAAVKLFDFNFFNIYQLDGTLEDWMKAGGSIEQ